MKILVCMLEFPTWELAKPWSYISGYAFVDALHELGHEVELNTLMYDFNEQALVKSVHCLARLGRHYEQAYFWLPHLKYSRAFWDAVEPLCRTRIAVLIESLQYTSAEIRRLPHPATRRREVLENLDRCTHVLTFDYGDFRYLEDRGYKAFWTPGIAPSFPEEICVPFDQKSPLLLAAGTIYRGAREALHRQLIRSALIDESERLRHSAELISSFEEAASALVRLSTQDAPPAEEEWNRVAERIMEVRRKIWYEYLAYLSRFAGVISLPAFFKGFPGRIFEAILTGGVAFICNKGHLRRHMQALPDDVHAFYFGATLRRADLARIRAIAGDRDFRRDFTRRARTYILNHFGAARIMERLVNWVANSPPRPTGQRRGVLMRLLQDLRRRPRYYNETDYEAS